jgi:hypothetical protein
MSCVRPPLLKKPSRGFAWACGPCSRAQERKLEARNTPNLADASLDADDEEIIDEDEDEGLGLGEGVFQKRSHSSQDPTQDRWAQIRKNPNFEDSLPPRSPKSRKASRRLKSVPSSGDAVLIGLLGGGKALEVARAAATELLASDDEMSDGSKKGVVVNVPTDNNDLAALAMGALKVHAAHFATTLNESAQAKSDEVVASPTTMSGNEGHSQVQPLTSMVIDSTNQEIRHLSPSNSGIKTADELAPIQEPSPKTEKSYGGFTPSSRLRFN